VIFFVFIFTKVLFIAVILPIFVTLTRIFFCGLFFDKILVGSFAESCQLSSPCAGSAREQRKSRVHSKPKSWTAMSSLSGT